MKPPSANARAMLAELKHEVGRLVVQTTASVAGKILTPEDHRRLAEETARHFSWRTVMARAEQNAIATEDTSAMKANRKVKRAARQLFRLCLVNGVLDEGRARQVAQRVAASRRRGALAVLSDFQRLVRLDSDRHTALVESATPLVPGMREDIQAGLTRVYGPGLEATFAENPALIGGMRIKVGSDVYDDSVRARLAALEARL